MRLNPSLLPLLLISSFASGTISFYDTGNDADDGGMLLVGNTITRTNVEEFADITKDIHDMKIACKTSNSSAARAIYEQGKNAAHSLRDLATNEDFIGRDMTFGFQMHGLSGAKAEDVPEYKFFASEHVEKLFDDDKCEAAVEAAQHIILWMHVSHELWNTVKSCAIAADPNYDNEIAGVDNLPNKIDKVAAYWIGSIQGEDPGGEEGNSLYSASNRLGRIFDTDIVGVARMNLNFLDGYEAISGILSDSDACDSEYSRTIEQMWPTVSDLSKLILIPQIQGLILSMLEEDYESIGIYATIVVPQLSQCRFSSYKSLKENLLDNKYNPANFIENLQLLTDLYPCLGISCLDIGFPKDHHDKSLGCLASGVPHFPTLAGYPTTTAVDEQAKIDLDMHQINILTQFDNEAYWQMARYIYKNGRNSKLSEEEEDDDGVGSNQFLSLHSLATSGERKTAKFYSDFISFYDDPKYADTLILNAFDNKERWKNRPLAQRAAVIRVTMQTHITLMTILSKLDLAVRNCDPLRDTETDDYYSATFESAWDEAAAFIIGSLEGTKFGGSDNFKDGETLWSLANRRSAQFGRQDISGRAITNNSIVTLLNAGKEVLEVGQCGETLERYVADLIRMLLVPIMQSVIKYALQNQFQTRGSDDVNIALGESYTESIVPIISSYDPQSGLLLMDNMMPVDDFQLLVANGPQAVADSFLAVPDLDCNLIGKSFEVDACLNSKQNLQSSGVKRSSIHLFRIFGFVLVHFAWN